MKRPRARLTLRRLMAAIATIAVSWSMCLGVAHLITYRANLQGERIFREGAAVLLQQNESARAAEWRQIADDSARRNREGLVHIATAGGLTVLGIIATALGLAIRARSGARDPARPRRVDAFVNVCLTIGAIPLAGLALGCIGYAGLLILVLATAD
jgi:hypothetical protein